MASFCFSYIAMEAGFEPASLSTKPQNSYIESSVESERRGDGRDDLSDEPVEVGVRRVGQLQVELADVVDGL